MSKNIKSPSDISLGLSKIIKENGLENNHHFKDTPKRVEKWVNSLFKIQSYPEMTTFDAPRNPPILILDKLETYAWCAHHLLPFKCDFTIVIELRDVMLGLSKYKRLIEYYASIPTSQEDITSAVFNDLLQLLSPHRMVVKCLSSNHSCMKARGVKDVCSSTTTILGDIDFLNNYTKRLQK